MKVEGPSEMKGLTYWWAKVQDSIKICFLRDPPTRAQLREQAQTFSNKIKTKYPPRLKQWERKEIGDKTKSKILLSIHWLNLPVFLLSLPTKKRLKRISPIKTLLSHLMIFAVKHPLEGSHRIVNCHWIPQNIKIKQLHRWRMMTPNASTNTKKENRRNLNSKGTEIITLILLIIFKEHNPPQLHHPSPSHDNAKFLNETHQKYMGELLDKTSFSSPSSIHKHVNTKTRNY